MKIMYELKLVCLNTIFYLSFIAFSMISIPLFVLFITSLSLLVSKRLVMKKFRRAISWYGAIIIRLLPFPFIRILFKDYGKKALKGPFLFVCNHRSASDAFLMSCIPYECVQVVNIWPFQIPVIGILARLAGYLNINKMPFEKFSQRACELLKQGVSIIAFPEGTRSGNGNMGQFHGSIFRVGLMSRCPIVPICISGNENIPQRGSLLLRPGTIKVHKLPALGWKEYQKLNPFKLKNKVRDIIAGELAVMEAQG